MTMIDYAGNNLSLRRKDESVWDNSELAPAFAGITVRNFSK